MQPVSSNVYRASENVSYQATIINEVLMKLVRPLFRKVSHRPYTSFNEVTFLRFVSSRIIQQGISDINRIMRKFHVKATIIDEVLMKLVQQLLSTVVQFFKWV